MEKIDARTGMSEPNMHHAPDPQPPATGRREIFLVDDDIELRDTLEFALATSDNVITTFAEGPAALEALLGLPPQKLPRLVLLSIDLPGLDGHTLQEQLYTAMPKGFIVVFLSTRGSDADQVRAFSAGALDYLVKPVSIPILLAKMKVWFDLCERAL